MAPLFLGLRRLRARRWRALAGGLGVTVAVGLLPAVSVLGVLAREESARERVGEFSARERIVQVAVHAREGRRSRAGH